MPKPVEKNKNNAQTKPITAQKVQEDTAIDSEKKIRKKLRQIALLQDRLDDGWALDDDQKLKLDGKSELEAELERLEKRQ